MIKADLLKKEILEADTSEALEKMICSIMDIFIDAIKNQMLFLMVMTNNLKFSEKTGNNLWKIEDLE